METAKTLAVLKALADGIDPATGEQFPAGSAYQHPDTVRALFSAISMLGNAAPPASPKPGTTGKSAPENSGRPWSEEEDGRLGKTYDSGKSIEELAGIHKRSKWAIEARLARLGKIPAPPSRFPARSSSGNTATA
ncbi:MAG: hypothetical protein HY067_06230 [Betaproteobacteria bacterium]|nr:hypothetical protein [Betaproteobacteria bacterium]